MQCVSKPSNHCIQMLTQGKTRRTDERRKNEGKERKGKKEKREEGLVVRSQSTHSSRSKGKLPKSINILFASLPRLENAGPMLGAMGSHNQMMQVSIQQRPATAHPDATCFQGQTCLCLPCDQDAGEAKRSSWDLLHHRQHKPYSLPLRPDGPLPLHIRLHLTRHLPIVLFFDTPDIRTRLPPRSR